MNTRASVCLLLLLTFGVSSLSAQTTTVSAGAGYADEVYFSLTNGMVQAAPLDEWDIAVEVAPGFTASIMTNDGKGILLYVVPDKGAIDFGDWIDTTGMAAGWESSYNSGVSWDQGAFNGDSDPETGNFGWGEYNMITHTVGGTTLYVLVLPDGSARQVAVQGLASRTYTILIADLDGENRRTVKINKDDYPDRQFAYYSIMLDKVIDREPGSYDWDLLFGKYIAMVGPGADVPYGVFGVRSAPGIRVAEVETSDPQSAPVPTDTLAYSDAITTIGYDWKNFTGTGWELRDVVYFVKDREEDLYRLYFTGFEGSSTGTSTFELQLVGISSVTVRGERVADFALYPNVISAEASLSCIYSLDRSASEVRFSLVDMAGREVHAETLSSEAGFYERRLHVDLPSGEYRGVLEVDGVVVSRPVVVRW